MRKLAHIALLLVVTLTLGALPATAESPTGPKLLAVKFHADWCSTCRKMGSAFEDLRDKLDGKPVLFVLLDRTNQSTTHQAALHAVALDLGRVWDETPGTGFILLVDPASEQVVGKLTADLDFKQMTAEIEQRLVQQTN